MDHYCLKMKYFAWTLLLYVAASPALRARAATPGQVSFSLEVYFEFLDEMHSVCITGANDYHSTWLLQDTIMFADCDKTSISCLTQENVLLREKLYEQRQQLGAYACKADGIGPTGGFCLTKEETSVGGNDIFDSSITAEMIVLFQGKTVLDIGCGLGQYGKAFEQAGNIVWTGFDGAENIEVVTDGYVHYMDMTLPQWIGKRFDWVVSLEVGEHIPNESESVFIDNIARHASEGVVLSWAVPGQNGHHHINTQPNEHVIAEMRDRGFIVSDKVTERFREVAEQDYFTRTVMVFEKLEAPTMKQTSPNLSTLVQWLLATIACVVLMAVAVRHVSKRPS